MTHLALAVLLAAAPVNLKAGEPAPYAGALVDGPTASEILQKRRACEVEREACAKNLEACAAAPAGGSVWLPLLLGTVVGFVAGVLLMR